jgi:hypothetical protein
VGLKKPLFFLPFLKNLFYKPTSPVSLERKINRRVCWGIIHQLLEFYIVFEMLEKEMIKVVEWENHNDYSHWKVF